MEKLSKDNYESYYLDFLEGKLSEEEVSSMEAFLEANPECIVRDDLPSFHQNDTTTLGAWKNQLKAFVPDEKISSSNLELFLIAELEGELSHTKLVELQNYLNQNPEARREQYIVSQTKLQADSSILFTDKYSLKRSKTIPLWVPLLAVAAVLLLILMVIPDQSSVSFSSGVHSASSYSLPTLSSPKKTAFTENKTLRIASLGKQSTPVFSQIQLPKQELFEVPDLPKSNNKLENPNPIDQVVIKPARLPENKENLDESKTVYALAMKDQLPPLTRALSDVIKKEVVYQKGINEVANRKGFHIKIGRFEISTNRKITSKER